MKLLISGRPVEARLEYVDTVDRLMLRTAFALLTPESTRQLEIRVIGATDVEVELLKVSGYTTLSVEDPALS